MQGDSTLAAPARLSRTLILAAVLALVGLARLVTDVLTDVDPGWLAWLGDSPLRSFLRFSDGSRLAELNVQYFKLLAVPCGLSVVFLLNAGYTGGLQAAERRWAKPRFRLAVIVALTVLCTYCEIEKATHLFGLPTALMEGERAWLNHVVHAVGALLAWPLSKLLRYTTAPTGTDAATGRAP